MVLNKGQLISFRELIFFVPNQNNMKRSLRYQKPKMSFGIRIFELEGGFISIKHPPLANYGYFWNANRWNLSWAQPDQYSTVVTKPKQVRVEDILEPKTPFR